MYHFLAIRLSVIYCSVITARNEVGAGNIFSSYCAKNSVHGGSTCTGIPSVQVCPPSRYPPGRYIPWQVPPQAGHPRQVTPRQVHPRQVHPQAQYTPLAGTFPGTYTPPGKYYEIYRSMSEDATASYWNAFLFESEHLLQCVCVWIRPRNPVS